MAPHYAKKINRRPMELLQLLVADYTMNEAAEKMGIARSTAAHYSEDIRAALGCQTMYGAIGAALRAKLITIPTEPVHRGSVD